MAVTSGPNPPTPTTPDSMWFNTTTGQMNYYDGSNWVPISAAGAQLNATTHLGVGQGFTYVSVISGSPVGIPAISSPSRYAMIFDAAHNRLWVYNDAAWVSVLLA